MVLRKLSRLFIVIANSPKALVLTALGMILASSIAYALSEHATCSTRCGGRW